MNRKKRITAENRMEKNRFKFEFAGFQEDGMGGVFPLFTVIHKFNAHPVLTENTTLSGKGLSGQGFVIPPHAELEQYKKGDIIVLLYKKPKTFHLKIRFLSKEILDAHGVVSFSVDQDRKSGDIHYIQWTYLNGKTNSVTSVKKNGIKSFVVKEEKINGKTR